MLFMRPEGDFAVDDCTARIFHSLNLFSTGLE